METGFQLATPKVIAVETWLITGDSFQQSSVASVLLL